MGSVGALVSAIAAAAAAAAHPAPDLAPPRAQRFASPSAAVAEALSGAEGGVVAFGELHQTLATAHIPSALHRFTDELLPGLAARFSHLVVETWMTTGRCGEAERAVTEDVERTTERPAQTETEIEALLRAAHERGVAPRILSISCADYQAMRGSGAGVDYDRTLRVTAGALETAILRALASPPPPSGAAPSAGPRLVGVYGGALHNDLHPDPELAAYSFAPRVLGATLGRYVEIDLVVPEYAAQSAAVRAQTWWRAYERARRPGAAVLVRRDARSFVVIFAAQASGVAGRPRPAHEK
jgi:hypothetical protein